MKFLITGSAGFVGFHLARLLLDQGHRVAGIDGMTPYYDVRLKQRRHGRLQQHERFSGHELMLEDDGALGAVLAAERPDVIVHLAAQAGVRYSIENPRAYLESNVVGTFNLLEHARALRPRHLMMASTSSVYGAGEALPFAEAGATDHPLSLYAATKKSTEVIAHAYAHLFDIPTTVFRFFTIYGPWGRPDMALFKFTAGILEDRPIDVYNHGQMERDLTYVADLVEAVARLAEAVPARPAATVGEANPAGGGEAARAALGSSPTAPYRVVNIGNAQPVRLLDFIEEIERAVGRRARRNMLPMQPGDVPRTWADTSLLRELTGYTPSTPVSVGVPAFVAWYRDYYGV